MTITKKRHRYERGTALSETVILLPLLLTLLLVAVDFGRLIYSNQVIVDLTRETANLVSRGSTFDEGFAASFRLSGEVDVQGQGGVIITEIRRKDAGNAQPWIFRQEKRGALASAASRVGSLNGKATIPGVTQLPVGVTVMAVEIVHPFDALFDLAALRLNFYPEFMYEAAFF